MKAILRNAIAAAAVLTAAGAYAAHPAMLIGYNSLDAIDNYQEYEAARWFSLNVKDAELITPADAATKINAKDIDCLWINIDRLNTGKGNLPAAFTAQATLDAIRQYLADGIQNFDVGAVKSADGDSAAEHKLHVAGAGSFRSRKGNLFGNIRRGHKHF